MDKKSIGIFGGTFDPIHFGHCRAALEIKQQLKLEELRLIPCKNPPHRTTIASAEDRLAMLKLAVKNTPLMIDDCEMLRSGPSYTVDTLLSLRKAHPRTSLCLIIAMDAFLGLPTWYEWEKLIELANIAVIDRQGWNMPGSGILAEFFNNHALASKENIIDFTCGKIVLQSITSLDISASNIRLLIQKGHSPQFLLPDSVLEYIQKHTLYSPP